MTRLDLIRALNWMNGEGHWLVTRQQFRVLFRGESAAAQDKALHAHTKAGLIIRVAAGLYANPNSTVVPSDPLRTVAQYLRPNDVGYVSMEYALHARGALSQMPAVMTIMTTGRSGAFRTPFGTIEFIHTARPPSGFPGSPDETFPLADVATARRDMLRAGRRLGFSAGSLDDALEAA